MLLVWYVGYIEICLLHPTTMIYNVCLQFSQVISSANAPQQETWQVGREKKKKRTIQSTFAKASLTFINISAEVLGFHPTELSDCYPSPSCSVPWRFGRWRWGEPPCLGTRAPFGSSQRGHQVFKGYPLCVFPVFPNFKSTGSARKRPQFCEAIPFTVTAWEGQRSSKNSNQQGKHPRYVGSRCRSLARRASKAWPNNVTWQRSDVKRPFVVKEMVLLFCHLKFPSWQSGIQFLDWYGRTLRKSETSSRPCVN